MIDTSPNCGNMLAGVGPFAIEAGLVAATAPETRVRIHNVNTGKLIEAIVQTPDGAVVYEGDAAIDGVPGTAAPIRLSFLDAAGSKTGRLLPTGAVRDRIMGVEVSCIDMAMPMVILRAADLGKTGHERPAELDADRAFFERLEAIRREAGSADGAGRRRRARHPQARAGLAARGRRHARRALLHAHAPATEPSPPPVPSASPRPASCRAASPRRSPGRRARARRLGSRSSTRPGASRSSSSWRPPVPTVPVLRASLVRTARRLFAGSVFVPDPLSTHHQGDRLMLKRRASSSPRPPPRPARGDGAASRRRPPRPQTYPDRPIRLAGALCRRRRDRRRGARRSRRA